MKTEIWKDIPGYEGLYQVSNMGSVKSLIRNKILKQNILSCYYQVRLYKNNIWKVKYVHRIVAECFIPNTDNKSCINHIDCNKLNNIVSNLEWCTSSENQKHALANNLIIINNSRKKINQYDLNGNYLGTFESMNNAAKLTNSTRHGIGKCVKGIIKQTNGFTWRLNSIYPMILIKIDIELKKIKYNSLNQQEYQKQYYSDNIDTIKYYNKNYYQINKEKILERCMKRYNEKAKATST